jgi:hypothetical protein
MKITKRQLKKIIRKTISESFEIGDHDWYDFQKMARAGNDIGCAKWIENKLDKLNGSSPPTRSRVRLKYILELEDVYELIDYAKNKTVTELELQAKFNELIGTR